MKEYLLKHRTVVLINGAAVLLISGAITWAYYALRGISQPLIVHFSDYAGINYVGNLKSFMAIGVLALMTALINSFLAGALDTRDWFLGKLTTFVNASFAILIFIGFTVMIFVNQ